MVGNRTGPLTISLIRKVLTVIGRPFLKSLLVLSYSILFLISLIPKTPVYLNKLINYINKRSASLSSLSEKINILVKLRSYIKLTNLLKETLPSPIKLLKIPSLTIKSPKTFIKLSIITLFIILVSAGFYSLVKYLPSPDKLINRKQIISTKIYDRNGNLLYKVFKNENRTLVQLKDIPPYLIKATISIEDKDFYKHAGYSYTGILRAIRQTIIGGKLQGGSTITQQLIKNALLSKDRSINRKIKEIILAVIVEIKFSKDEILTMYFNEVAYGGAAYGVEEASQMYFGKPAKNLSLAEATLIAGLPAAPTYFSPFGTHPELAKFRQHEVLRRMVEDGYITAETAEKVKAEKLEFTAQSTDIKAPHFVMYIKQLLVDKFGEELVEQGGLEVITTLDLAVQNLAQQVVTQEVNSLKNLNINNGAALVTKPETGEILAMIGSKDFFDLKNDGQVNVTLRPRQPGSAIKPINYAVALENNFTAATMLADTPITYHIPGQPPYSPKNYDNTYHGNITLREALANSYNVPAVKTLSVFGVEQMIKKGQQMGITTWKDKSDFGLSLTLGGGDVIMTDLATAYGSLANDGYRVDLTPILKVSDYKGKILYQYTCRDYTAFTETTALASENGKCNKQKIIEPEIAFLLSDILSDNQARSRAFGSHSLLNIPNQQVAVKTGTTQNLRDNWTIGYTQHLLVATWVGNNDNSPMSYVASGITGATPIWNKIITPLLAEKPKHKFMPPNTLLSIDICPYTGTLACNGCPNRPEFFIKGTEPTATCILNKEEISEDSTYSTNQPERLFTINKPESISKSNKKKQKIPQKKYQTN